MQSILSKSIRIVVSVLKNTFFITFPFFVLVQLNAQQNARYNITFTDKKYSHYSVYNPLKYLSQRAIERRLKYGIPITPNDFPVSKPYIDSIEALGLKMVHTSRWFNSAVFDVPNEVFVEQVAAMPFVKGVEKRRDALQISQSIVLSTKIEYSFADNYSSELENSDWGFRPLYATNLIELHNKGFDGAGVHVAIIDAGFWGADTGYMFRPVWSQNRLLGFRDFIANGSSVFSDGVHGTIVLGVLAANEPGLYTGVAPAAKYWLLRSEDINSEYPVEEDNWIAAVEFADSAGADVINTSLGYRDFDNPKYNHSYSDLNGKILRISQAAQMAAARGILLTISAGNSGKSDFPYIGAPADAFDIITVGAVDENNQPALFSSIGPTADGRLKPELVAPGTGFPAYRASGWAPNAANGTSFSAPVVAGLAACLLQAYPNARPHQIIGALTKTASYGSTPDNKTGFGIPDAYKAYTYLAQTEPEKLPLAGIYPAIFSGFLVIKLIEKIPQNIRVECFSAQGQKQFEIIQPVSTSVFISSQVQKLTAGVYFFRVSVAQKFITLKAVKTITSNVDNY